MRFEPISVSILTGFLGAGKTTLLNRLLKSPALTNAAVIVNEFGEVGLDHLLVEESSEGIIELSDGCLCCTVRGDLVDTLAELIERRQTGRIEKLERIVIETSGLADPVPVMQAVMGHPVLQYALRLDGVVALADAVNGLSTLDRHEEARRQVAVADRLVLTKTDIADAGAADALIARIRALNPRARLLVSGREGEPADLMRCGLYDPETKTADVRAWLGDAHDDHDGHDQHDHHHHRHDDGIRTVALEHDGPVAPAAIEMFLDLLRAQLGPSMLRMKGIIETADDPDRPLVIHGVQAMLHPPVRLPRWPGGFRGTRIVIIGHGMEEDYLRRLFGAFLGEPALDMPDRQALSDNPLAIAGFRP